MNVTSEDLRQIIKEELESVLSEKSDIAKQEELLEGWLQKALAGGALALGMMGAPNTAQADNPTAPSDVETTQQAEAEYNPYHVLLGMLDFYIDSKPLEDKHDVNMDFAKVQVALDQASDGNPAALEKLEGRDADLLKLLEKHVEKYSGDQELIDYWGNHGTTINIEYRTNYEEGKKKKACKPSKGKRFAKRVDGKCRSFGQKGQAKGGGDRIRPGTKKGDAYCARSLKIKKCKNPPCANALSRKKWKCKGAKSMK